MPMTTHALPVIPGLVRQATAFLPTAWGEFTIHGYQDPTTGAEHVALVMGDPTLPGTLVRLHSECLTGDAFGSLRCDCGPQRDHALAAIAKEGRGVLVYLRQEGRGIGLLPKLKAYALQETGLDTVEANLRLGFGADERSFAPGAQILADLGVGSVRLLTNNPYKVEGLRAEGIDVLDRVPSLIPSNVHNQHYMQTKAAKLDHLL